MMFMLIIIFVGLFFWFSNMHVLVPGRDWPLILVFAGLLNFFDFSRKNARQKILDDLDNSKITAAEAEEKLKNL